MAFYDVQADGPRPGMLSKTKIFPLIEKLGTIIIFLESYYEDYIDAQNFSTSAEKTEFYTNMKSGAESGWDYSTKWYF